MKTRLIVFDIDGTLTRHVSSWQFIHERLGLWENEAVEYQNKFLAGEISYKKFCRLDAAHWKGIPEKRMTEIFKKVPYARNAQKALALLKKEGFSLAGLSTGVQFMVNRAKDELELDFALGNRLRTRNGLLTGGVKIKIPHLGKDRALRSIACRFGTEPSLVISVGDSEGDLPMMRISGFSIAFNPRTEAVCRAADYCCRSDDFMEVCDRILENSPSLASRTQYWDGPASDIKSDRYEQNRIP